MRKTFITPESQKSIARDNRTLAIYLSLRCDRGRPIKVLCRGLKIPKRTLQTDLIYLSKGGLAEYRDGRWWRPIRIAESDSSEHMKAWGNERDRVVRLIGSTHRAMRKFGVGVDECGVPGVW
jgi:hypothetical protein